MPWTSEAELTRVRDMFMRHERMREVLRANGFEMRGNDWVYIDRYEFSHSDIGKLRARVAHDATEAGRRKALQELITSLDLEAYRNSKGVAQPERLQQDIEAYREGVKQRDEFDKAKDRLRRSRLIF